MTSNCEHACTACTPISDLDAAVERLVEAVWLLTSDWPSGITERLCGGAALVSALAAFGGDGRTFAVTEVLAALAGIADEIAVIRSIRTDEGSSDGEQG